MSKGIRVLRENEVLAFLSCSGLQELMIIAVSAQCWVHYCSTIIMF